MARALTLDRYWSKVEVCGPDECWPWTGGTKAQGYGIFFVQHSRWKGKRWVGAHVFAYILATKEDVPDRRDPPHYGVLHRCNNPPCCNARHLYLGTAVQNSADMLAAGRDVGKRRLTAQDYDDILARTEAGDRIKDVAEAYGVNASHVSNIKAGRGRRPPK